MSARLPAKEKAGSSSLPGYENSSLAYRIVDLVQAPFGFIFWALEQRKARIQDRIENERSSQ